MRDCGEDWPECSIKEDSLRFVGENMTGKLQTNKGTADRARLLQKLRYAAKKMYGKKNLSRIGKLRHYTTTIRNATLYALGLTVCTHFDKEERKMFERYVGHQKQS